jgi:hypothetical protein
LYEKIPNATNFTWFPDKQTKQRRGCVRMSASYCVKFLNKDKHLLVWKFNSILNAKYLFKHWTRISDVCAWRPGFLKIRILQYYCQCLWLNAGISLQQVLQWLMFFFHRGSTKFVKQQRSLLDAYTLNNPSNALLHTFFLTLSL